MGHVLNPFLLFPGLFVLVSFAEAPTGEALLYVLAMGAAVVISVGYLAARRRGGKATGFWLPQRAERIVPAAVLLGIGAVLLLTLSLLSAPIEVLTVMGAMYVAAIIAAAITFLWQISIHGMVAGYCAACSLLLFGFVWWGLIFLLGASLVIWARTTSGAHTLPQAVGGALLGATVGSVFVGQI